MTSSLLPPRSHPRTGIFPQIFCSSSYLPVIPSGTLVIIAALQQHIESQGPLALSGGKWGFLVWRGDQNWQSLALVAGPISMHDELWTGQGTLGGEQWRFLLTIRKKDFIVGEQLGKKRWGKEQMPLFPIIFGTHTDLLPRPIFVYAYLGKVTEKGSQLLWCQFWVFFWSIQHLVIGLSFLFQ